MKKQSLLLALATLFAGQILYAQKIIRIKKRPSISYESNVPKGQVIYIPLEKKLHLKPILEPFEDQPELFTISLECEDPDLNINPAEGHPNWFTITSEVEKQSTRVSIYATADEHIRLMMAFPRDRDKPVQNDKGDWIHANIEWLPLDFLPGEKVKIDDLNLKAMSIHRNKKSGKS